MCRTNAHTSVGNEPRQEAKINLGPPVDIMTECVAQQANTARATTEKEEKKNL